MNDKIEISRELAERITNNQYLDKERISIARHEALFELRGLLAAPAVELSDDARDARRYRLLRSGEICIQDAGYGDIGGIYVWDQRGEKHQECGNAIYGEELDAALDAEPTP